MTKQREKIPAAFWWRSAADDFDKVIREFLKRAQKAEHEEKGHECGHRFEITVRSSTHVSGPGEHIDADYYDAMRPVEVRAHSLRGALLIAAALPFGEWFEPEGDDGEDQPEDCPAGCGMTLECDDSHSHSSCTTSCRRYREGRGECALKPSWEDQP